MQKNLLLLPLIVIKYFNMYKFIFLVLFFYIIGSVQANKKVADSLSYEIINTTDIVDKANLQLDYCWETKYEDLDNSINKTNEAMKVLLQNNFQPGISKGYSYIGVYKYLQDSIPQAISYLEMAEKMLLTQNNPELLARVYNNLGVFYGAMYDNETALSFYQKSLEIKEQMGDNVDISSNLINISTIFYDEGRYEECIETNEQALIYALKNDDVESIAVIYANLGAANERLGNFKIGTNYTLKALNIYQNSVKNDAAEARTYSNLGANYLSQKEFEEAKYYFSLALDINKRINHSSNLVVSNNNMAEVEGLLKNFDKAEKYVFQALELANQLNYVEEKRICFEELSLITEDQGDYKESLRFYKLYVNIRDSLIEVNQTDFVQKALIHNQSAMQIIQSKNKQELETNLLKEIEILKVIFYTLIILVIARLLLPFILPNLPGVIIISLNYFIPYLISISSGMYILLKTDLPQTLNLLENFGILCAIMIVGILTHLLLIRLSNIDYSTHGD